MFDEHYKGVSIRKNGDILEVKLRDENYHPFFSDKARINNKKDMIRLLTELKKKGVPL